MFVRVVIYVVIALLFPRPAFAQAKKVDVTALKQLLVTWNDAHSLEQVNTFYSLFADTVNFYGKTMARVECVTMKESLLRKYGDFRQVIKGDMVLSAYTSGVIRCEFVKTVSYNNKTVDYKAYLVVRRAEGEYIIVGESDVVTDHNLQIDPYFGKQVAIKGSTREEVQEEDVREAEISHPQDSEIPWLYILTGTTLVGVFGVVLFVGIRRRRFYKRDQGDQYTQGVHLNERVESSEAMDAEQYRKGMAFEQYVTTIFNKRKDYFILMDWRSDKFHDGIYPQSNRNPDLVYEYRCGAYVRRFAVECKYRAKPIKGQITLIKDEMQFRIYEEYHRREMPVYVVIGVGGKPELPNELFLIPFDEVQSSMRYKVLTRYRKLGGFYYDMNFHRLT